MGKNKNGGQASSGGVGSTGGVPTLTLEQFADALAPSGGGGGGGRGGGKSATSKSGAHKSGDASTSGAPTVEVARWDVDPRVHLLRFASAAAQRDAMGRPRPSSSRTSTSTAPSPNAYPRGNAAASPTTADTTRARDLARFINGSARKDPGSRGDARGIVLVAALVVRRAPLGQIRSSRRAARDDLVVAAVAGSSDKNEVRDALLHEAMHMVFYVDEAFAERCWSFWRERATERDKTAWIAFLRDLRYNVEDEEVGGERTAGVRVRGATDVRGEWWGWARGEERWRWGRRRRGRRAGVAAGEVRGVHQGTPPFASIRWARARGWCGCDDGPPRAQTREGIVGGL